MILQQFKSYLLSSLVILIITPIFLESFGTHMFSTTEFRNESRAFYLISNIIGQTFFPIFSKIDKGCLLIPHFEGMSVSRKIYSYCLEKKVSNPIGETLFCLLISCFISFLGGISLFLTNTGDLLARMPRSIVDTMAFATCLFVLHYGCYNLFYDEKYILYSILMLLTAISITIFSIFILNYFKNPKYLLLLLISIILICNSLLFAFSMETLQSYKIFNFTKIPKISLSPILNLKIQFTAQTLQENLSNIFNLGTYSLINISTALPYYFKTVKLSGSLNREILAQGLTNGMCGLGFCPVNFNSSGSVLFALCGASTRSHSIVSGISLILLYFIYHHITPSIPIFAVSLIFQFIGIHISMSLISQVYSSTKLDKFILFCSICAIFIYQNPIFIIISGVVINYVISLFYTVKSSKIIKKQTNEQTLIFSVHGNLDFRNIHEITNFNYLKFSEICLDFSNCDFVDYTANLEIEMMGNLIKENNQTLKVFGNPNNLNNKISQMK